MDEDNKIDKLFKDRLKEDNPPFKEEYWQGFEEMLKAVPPAGSTASAGGLGKILTTLTLTKGIIAVVSVAVVSSLIYFGVRYLNTENPGKDLTQIAADSSNQSQAVNASPAESLKSYEKAQVSQSQSSIASSTSSTTSAPDVPSKIAVLKTLKKDQPDNPVVINRGKTGKSSEHNKLSGETQSDVAEMAQNKSNGIQKTDLVAKPGEENTSVIPEAGKVENEEVNKDKKEEIKGRLNEPAGKELNSQVNEGISKSPEDNKTDGNVVKEPVVNDSINYDSIIGVIESAAKNKQDQATALQKDSRVKFYVVPGAGFYNTAGNISGFNDASQVSFQFGGGFSYRLSNEFSLYAEANALRIKGFELVKSSIRTEYLFYQWMNSVSVENREFTLMNIPVLIRYQYKQHCLSAGPTVRYLLSSTGEKVVMDSTFSYRHYENSKVNNYLGGFNRIQAGLALEYSWNFYRENAILVRYNYMLNDFIKTSYYSGTGNKKMNMLFFGCRFRIY